MRAEVATSLVLLLFWARAATEGDISTTQATTPSDAQITRSFVPTTQPEQKDQDVKTRTALFACDIDYNDCLQDLGGNFTWERTQGRDRGPNWYKPHEDHTYGAVGRLYMYADVTLEPAGSMATMATLKPIPPAPSPVCASFWYYADGLNVGTYALVVVHDDAVVEIPWSDKGGKGGDWHNAKVSVDLRKYPGARIGFTVAQVVSSGIGGVAIDDITVTSGICTGSAGICPPNVVVKTENQGSILSPGFISGVGYPSNLTCRWLISVPDVSSSISLQLIYFKTERLSDRLDVYDGESSNSSLLAGLSGDRTGEVVYSPGPQMYLRFTTDRSTSERGFSLQYQTLVVDPLACPPWIVRVTAASGSIVSPGYPNHDYPNRASCSWLITSPNITDVIRLEFISFLTESAADHLSIFDGENNSSQRLFRASGIIKEQVITSSGPHLYLQFTSDGSVQSAGFELQYSTVEPTGPIRFDTPEGTIESPRSNLGSHYPNNAKVHWLIVSPNDTLKVRLERKQFATEINMDILRVYDGGSDGFPVLAYWTGTYPDRQAVISTGPTMYLRFTSDGSITSTGFFLAYSTVSHGPSCSPDVAMETNSSGNIFTPGFQDNTNYPNNASCQWIINTANKTLNIALVLKTFITEDFVDFLEVFDSDDMTVPLARLSGNITGQVITNTGHSMYLRFTSGASRSFPGFHLTYTAVEADRGSCPHDVVLLNESRGHVATPGDLLGYPENASCEWHIQAEEEQMVIKLALKEFSTESGSDFLDIYDGSSKNSRRMAHLSGERTGSVLSSSGPSLFLHFTSDDSYMYRGFYIEYMVILPPRCPPVIISLNNTSGNISSPGYMNGLDYPTNATCRWRLVAPSGNMIISLEVTSFYTERFKDYLHIYDGSDSFSRVLASLSGRVTPRRVTSSGPELFLHFTSDESSSRAGFLLSYTVVDLPKCSSGVVSLNQSSGNIFSPGFTNGLNYPNNALCQWRITAPTPNTKISLEVTSFSTERSSDFLYIYDGSSPRSLLLTSLSGSVGQQTYTSSGPAMFLRFSSNGFSTGRGFSLSYHFVVGELGSTPRPNLTSQSSLDPSITIQSSLQPSTNQSTLLETTPRPRLPPHCGQRYLGKTNSYSVSVGYEATPHSWPWLIPVLEEVGFEDRLACLGIILTGRHVMVPATCIIKRARTLRASLMYVSIGDHVLLDGRERRVSSFMLHPFFSRKHFPYENNVAILVLREELNLTGKVAPICMPPGQPLDGSQCYAAGWRITEVQKESSSDVLLEIPREIVGVRKCEKRYRLPLRPSYFCVSGNPTNRSSSEEDLGTPLMCDVGGRFYVAGVFSHYSPTEENPDIYLNVYHYKQWITDTINY